MPPRGRKAQAPRPASPPTREEDDVETPGTVPSEAEAAASQKIVKKTRGKAVAKTDDEMEAKDGESSEAAVSKPRKKAAANKKETDATPEPSENASSTKEAKKGRGREKKVTGGEDVQAETVETSEAPKRGKGRAKKADAVVDEPTDSNEVDSEPAASAPITKAKPVRGAAKNKEVEKETNAVEETTKGRGRGRKVTEAEEPAAAEEAVVVEKKKRGGKKVSDGKETSAQADVVDQQPVDDVIEAEAGPAPPASRKGRARKTPQKNKTEERLETANDEEENAEEVAASTIDAKKRGRGRKAATVAEVEHDQADELPILQVQPSNIETRKGRGTPRAVTPVLPKTPTQVEKGRGRNKKEPVLTPQSTGTDNVQVAEEPKKRGGRSKKPIEKPEEVDPEVGSPSDVPKERKRKDGGTQSQIAKKTIKQK